MAKSLAQVMKGLPGPRRKQIKQRSAVLIHEQLTLQQLCRELKLTQDNMADLLELKQGNIPKIERRS